MCGIAGVFRPGGAPGSADMIRRMTAVMERRGPDATAVWTGEGMALGHTRLSIVDIHGGGQPMANEDGNLLIVFNGEIYNHRELRKELEAAGHMFGSDHSDTETIIHGYEQWGAEVASKLNGMFAFAIWDKSKKSLYIARDRYGIKPLYLFNGPDGALLFASEVRALVASGIVEKRESARGVLEYFLFQNTWGSQTMFEGVEMFPAGQWMRLDTAGRTRRQYWDVSFSRSAKGSLAEAAEGHKAVLEKVIARQTDADVTVSSYLSGGVDSSSIACMAHKLDRGIRAYTCGFNLDGVGWDRVMDEREDARFMASHVGLDHVEIELDHDAIRNHLEETVTALEYPRMGMSYENFLIAKRVAQDAKVVLSGLGGDEYHAGYLYRYKNVASYRGVTPGAGGREAIINTINHLIPERDLERAFCPGFLGSAGEYSVGGRIDGVLKDCPSDDIYDQVMYLDAKTFMCGLLAMEDKLSMWHSLETRVPLLDNELVDYALDLPWDMLLDENEGKIVFRKSIAPFVPGRIANKPKMGFSPPDASWYKGPLREWISHYLRPEAIARRGVLRPEYVADALEAHFSGKSNFTYLIWAFLSFEAWCSTQGVFGGRL